MHKERLCFGHRENLERERDRNKSRWLIALCSVVFSVFAAFAAPVQITEKTNPKIVELYQKLQDKRAEVSGIESKRVDALNENLNAMRENEQRIENRILGATTTLATGMGAMQAATGLAETAADERALADMRAYLSTFVCEFGNGQNVEYGPGDVTLPGGNELMEYYNEYKTLAEDLRKTKVALGLAPGIESEEILERADTGLYDNVAIGKTSGMYASLARGILNPDGDDAAQIAADTQKSAEKLKAGAIAAGAGVVGGIIGNYKINKDAPKESSKQINQEYDAQLFKINQEAAQIETELDAAIAENAAAVREYNAAVESARKNVDEIQRAPTDCQELFSQYITDVSKLELVENETDSVPDITLPEMDSDLLAKCVQCKNKDAIFDAAQKTCECPAERPLEQDGKCIAKPAEPEPVVTPEPVDTEQDEAPAEKTKNVSDDTAEYCPAKGNALKSITDKSKVGDACNSDIISQGTITKRKNGTCTCLAAGCWSPYTPKNGQCIKDKSETSTGSESKNDYVDENGFCKPYKHTNWFFNNEGNEQISKYFNKICDDFAKAHNCKRKDLNTGKRINTEGEQGKQNYAFEYEWICNADSKDYLETQERINKRNQNLSYENVCNKLKPGQTTTENGIKRQCVGLFSDINIPDYKTQLELAKARIGTAAACSEKRETRKNKSTNNPSGYYTNCNTTNDKEHYTFIFSGVSNNTTSPENLMQAACAIYGVKFGGTSAGRKQPYCNYTYKSIENDPICNKIDTLAQKFGYSARIIRGTGCVLDTTGGIGGATLTDSGMRSDEKIRDLKTAFGIDNTLFANISTNMDEWLYDQMKNIVSNEMKRAGHSDPLVSFECFPTKSFALDKGIEAKLHLFDGGSAGGRNVLTCRANGRDIDFVFQKLGHVTKRRANASKEGLTCIFGSNGKYDGRQCWGITEEDCTKLNNTIKEHAKNCSQCGANWLPKVGDPEGFCSLTKSTKVEKTNKGLEIAGNVALIAGGAVLTVMSGGMAMPMLVTELALMGVELTGATVAAVEEKHMRNVAEEFLRKTQYCHDATCAQELLTDSEVHRILNLESNLDDKISNTIDDKMSELLGVIPDDAPLYVALLAGIEDKPNCNFWRNATAQCEWAQFWHAWANVAQFASLGVALGRSAVRFIHARQAITKVATQTAKKMTRAQAKRISEIDKKIATLESKVNRTQKEAAELTKLRQERNTILNKVGTKDADEVAKLSAGAYNPEIEKAQSEYQKLLKEREALAKRMGTDKAPGKVEVQTMDKQIAAAEKKLKDLGADVEPVEPLWGNKNPTGTKPKTDTPEPKPAEPTAEPTATPKAEPVTPTGAPVTPQSRVYEKLGDKVKADIADIKSGKAKELNIPSGQLTDDEWKILKDDLAKDGLEITDAPGNMYYTIKKSGKADEVAQATSKADNAAKSTNKASNADDAARGAGAVNPTVQKLQDMGFVDNGNGVFISKQQPYSYTVNQSLDNMSDIKWTYLNVDGTSEGPKIYIAMSKEAAAKQGLRWSDEAEDFVRAFNSQSSYRISKLNGLISSRKALTEINGVPVYVRNFGEHSGRPIVMVEINGKQFPFYASTGSAGKNTVPTGKWEFFGGIGPDGWFNKLGTDDILAHYNSPELRKIANALDSQIGDVRNVEYVMMSQGRASLNGAGSVGAIDNVQGLSTDVINSGLNDLGYYPNVRGTGSPRRNIEGVTDWLSNQRAVPPAAPASSATSASRGAASGASNAGARAAGSTTNINTLRNRASSSFDKYLDQVKTNKTGLGAKLPKARLTDAEWEAINKSLAHENVQLVEVVQDGEHYMQFRRADAVDDVADAIRGAGNVAHNAIPSDFSPVAKEYINQINDIGQTRDYVVIKGVGKRNSASPLTRKENDYVNQLLEGRNDLIARPITQENGTGGTLGANKIIVQKTDDMFSVETSTGIDWVRRLTTKPVDNLRGKSITTINGKPVFLEPLDNGGLIGNVSGRPVVVVNYNGHKIPFYTSSGKAGKLKVPTGKWEVFFGFGKDNTGFRWLNKADIDSIVDHYGSPELRKIAEALDNAIGDQRNLEDVFQTISRKIYNGIGNVASYDGPVASEDFINSMLDFVPVNNGDNRILSNIEHVKSYFK